MHNAAFRALGWDAIYLAFDVAPENLMEALAGMRAMGFKGINLTIPLKEVAFRGVDHLGPSAQELGAVNTVLFRADGSIEGHCTDGYGLTKALDEAFGATFAGHQALILGCGGAGSAAARVAAHEGADCIRLANRTPDRALALAKELSVSFPHIPVEISPAWPPEPDWVHPAGIVLQSTAVGLKPDDPPLLTHRHFRPGQALLDMTYSRGVTLIMAEALAAGALAANGLGMLLHQGVRSFEIWTGETPPIDTMRAALLGAIQGGD
jgi:shikimate dehydrogenase